ncbi:hypothetical protein [Pseudooceanicola sp. 200-1SW]|uniref:hypothetical protein n=1 Tax=Pseudooceanicola sp. 200-1SW TaxID=3425949 RepID=UPI003D7F362C
MNTGRLILFFLPLSLLIAGILYVSGAGTGTSGATAVALLSLVGGGVLFIALPGAFLLRAYLIFTILLAGLIEYYGRVSGFMLAPSLLGLGLLLWGLPRKARGLEMAPAPAFIWLFALTAVVWCAFSLTNMTGLVQLIVSLITFLMVYASLPAVLMVTRRDPERHIDWFEKALACLPFLQLPITLHQRFFVARGTTNWDTVAGSFGGIYGGVGRNSDLMLFMIASFAMALHLYQSNRISGRLFWAIFAAVFVITGIGETKAFFVYLPILLVMQQWPRIKREPHKAILFGTVLLGAITLLWSAYATFNYGARYADMADVSALEMADATLERFLDTDNVDYEAGELGRVATLHIWYTHVQQDTLAAWVGYGLGASRISRFGSGMIALAYVPLKLTSTAAAQLLWDVGIIGFSLFLTTMLAAMRFGLVQSKRTRDALFTSRYRTIAGIALILILSLVYKPSMTESVTVKLLFMMLMALLWVTYSQDLRNRRARTEAPA